MSCNNSFSSLYTNVLNTNSSRLTSSIPILTLVKGEEVLLQFLRFIYSSSSNFPPSDLGLIMLTIPTLFSGFSASTKPLHFVSSLGWPGSFLSLLLFPCQYTILVINPVASRYPTPLRSNPVATPILSPWLQLPGTVGCGTGLGDRRKRHVTCRSLAASHTSASLRKKTVASHQNTLKTSHYPGYFSSPPIHLVLDLVDPEKKFENLPLLDELSTNTWTP